MAILMVQGRRHEGGSRGKSQQMQPNIRSEKHTYKWANRKQRRSALIPLCNILDILMAFHHERNSKTACTSTIALSFPFPFPVVHPLPPPSKHAPTARADSVCSREEKCWLTAQRQAYRTVWALGSTAQGATKCQVDRHQTILFDISFVLELTGEKQPIFVTGKVQHLNQIFCAMGLVNMVLALSLWHFIWCKSELNAN